MICTAPSSLFPSALYVWGTQPNLIRWNTTFDDQETPGIATQNTFFQNLKKNEDRESMLGKVLGTRSIMKAWNDLIEVTGHEWSGAISKETETLMFIPLCKGRSNKFGREKTGMVNSWKLRPLTIDFERAYAKLFLKETFKANNQNVRSAMSEWQINNIPDGGILSEGALQPHQRERMAYNMQSSRNWTHSNFWKLYSTTWKQRQKGSSSLSRRDEIPVQIFSYHQNASTELVSYWPPFFQQNKKYNAAKNPPLWSHIQANW